MTKHHLEIVLGLVRKANLSGRLYPRPNPGPERQALNFLVRSGAVVAQLATATSPAGYIALARAGDCAIPVRKAHAPLKVGRA